MTFVLGWVLRSCNWLTTAVTLTVLKLPHCWNTGPLPGNAKLGVSCQTVRSYTLIGSAVNGTVVTCVEGPNWSRIDELTSGGLPSGSDPIENGWMGSVNSIVIAVCGSTSTSLKAGEVIGTEFGGGVVATSGRRVSGPTVELPSTRRTSLLPSAPPVAVVARSRIWRLAWKVSCVERSPSVSGM